MSKVISYTRSFTVLPLTIALSTLLLSACSSSTGVNQPTYKSPSQVVKKSPSQRTTQPRPIVVDSNRAKKTTVSNAPAIGDDSEDISAYLDEESLSELADLLEATDMTMVENNQLLINRYGDLWDRVRRGYRINRPYNSRIEAQKKWFITRQDYLNRLTARSSRYLYHTVREAERRHIPTELALLPVIESSYDPTATSNAAAAGLWQFIPSTGRIYGLSQSSTYDGRRDVIESTRAAYDFLTSLYNQFGSWELALAAYNAGPGRIQKAIEYNESRGRPTDFWSLNLPTETMNYVPRFLAVADIVEQPRKYGVYFPAIANQQHFRSVPVNYGVSLTEISQLTGVSFDELQKLNPALIANRIDATGPQRVVIPNEVNSLVDKKISALKGYGDNSNIIAAAQTQYKPLPKPIVVQNTTSQAASNRNPSYSGGALPSSSDKLAEFVTTANASVPKQTTSYIPPISTGNRPIVNNAQLQNINQEFGQSNNLPTTSAQVTQNNTIIQEPPLTKRERDSIAEEIRRQSLNTTEVVSNVDGNIKLDAVQTQQSVLQSTGREKKLSFASSSNTYANSSSQPKGKRTTYKVKRGDTLINIASRAGLNWREIAQWNQIDPSETLLAGSVLYLYDAKPIAPLGSQQNTSSRPQSYTVQESDTLIGTANRFGLSVSQLASYNNLSTTANLIIGQKLWLVPGKVSTSSQSQNTSSTTATKTYQVQKGDGLIALANQFGMSVESLAALNGLETNQQLYIGQKLKVPASVDTSTNNTRPSTSSSSNSNNNSKGSAEYTVQAGDTLIGIANKLGLDAGQIAAVNDFNANSRLLRGQTIKLPVSQAKVDIRLNDEDVKYKVQSGDTLIGVANRYGVSVSALAAANGLSNNANLIRGRTITIPSGGTSSSSTSSSNTQSSSSTSSSSIKDTESYKVQSGDTLIGLANQLGVTPSELASLNNISSKAQLRRGQTLKVPKVTVSYTVRSGDTLIGLARKYGISTKELADMNNLSTNTQLRRGQRLTVPNR